MFVNTYVSFKMVLEDLLKWITQKKVMKLHKTEGFKWLQENENILKSGIGEAHFRKLVGISQEVSDGTKSNSGLFNCKMYEEHLRTLNEIAKKIQAQSSSQQLEWIYLMPFDERNLRNEPGDSEATRKRKRKWDKTLFDVAHQQGITMGETFKDKVNAEIGPQLCIHKCH